MYIMTTTRGAIQPIELDRWTASDHRKDQKDRNEDYRFLPDPEIFEKTRFKAEEVKSRMHETAYLNPESDHHLSKTAEVQ